MATRTARRLGLVMLLAATTMAVSGCAGVLDWCGKGLTPPADGWDKHGPV